MNERIRAKEVLVVAPDGEQIGVKDTDEALWLANQLGMDLVEVSSGSNPPVCRLMDYGKYKYEQSGPKAMPLGHAKSSLSARVSTSPAGVTFERKLPPQLQT